MNPEPAILTPFIGKPVLVTVVRRFSDTHEAEIDYGDGRALVTVADTVLSPVRPVTVSSFDDFVQHPGQWAVFNDPGLRAGDPVVFRFNHGARRYDQLLAVVSDCHRLTSADAEDMAFLHNGDRGTLSLDGWWLITYVGSFDELIPAEGDEQLDDAELRRRAEALRAAQQADDERFGPIRAVSTGCTSYNKVADVT